VSSLQGKLLRGHAVTIGTHCAVDFGDDLVFFGRVTKMAKMVGDTELEIHGTVSLQNRPAGIKVQFCWFEELPALDAPHDLKRNLVYRLNTDSVTSGLSAYFGANLAHNFSSLPT
jgi:hypothetical protein